MTYLDDYMFVTPSFGRGVARVVDLTGSLAQDSYALSDSPEAADAHALASDWRSVGRDLASAIRKFGDKDADAPAR